MCKCCRSRPLTCLSALNKPEYKHMFLACFSFMLSLYPQVPPKNLSGWSHTCINRLGRTACYFFQATNLFGERSGWYEFCGLFSLSLTLKEREGESERGREGRQFSPLTTSRLSLVHQGASQSSLESLWIYAIMKGNWVPPIMKTDFFKGSLSGF